MRRNTVQLIIAMISICMCSILLISCGKPVNTEPESASMEEGISTEIEITGYTNIGSNMFLKKSDKIAVLSPSTTPTRKQVDAVIKGLEEWGYVPVEGKYVCVEERTLQNCIDDLLWALNDSEIKAIFCVRGGYAANEVMDSITNDIVANAKKLIIGYSDITIYHSAWISAGFPSIHACMSATFTDMPKECVEAEQKLIQGQIPNYKCSSNEFCKEGSAKGILVGGNLSTFIACLGTYYDPTKLGKPYILFLEDVEEDYQHIHRCLTVLKHMGVLDNAAGIVFGEWTDVPKSSGDYDGNDRGGNFKSVEDMISRQLVKDLNIPIAFGFPAGHGDVNYPLLLGEEVEFTVTNDSFTLNWEN